MDIPALTELSNGRYRVSLSRVGGGLSSCDGLALNRWPDDPVEDAQGFFIYLRDLDSGALWSTTRQPTWTEPQRYEVSRVGDGLRVLREDDGILLVTTISVSPSDDLERREVALENRSGRPRKLELTSLIEVALAPAQVDLVHPAFAKLFVQTGLGRPQGALLAQRRPRGDHEHWPTAFHALAGAPVLQWETDRLQFIGRGRSTRRPAMAMSGTVGNVLDPVLSLRTEIELAPGETRQLSFILGVAANRRAVSKALKPFAPSPLPARSRKAAAPARNRMTSAFEADGSEYAIRMPANDHGLDLPPAPWVNVIANERFGCIVSETGAGCTWSRNSQANRLTPWANDPVCDAHGEALYLRDEDSGRSWSPLPGPAPAAVPYETRHGFGYTSFRCSANGIEQEATAFVAQSDPLKVVRLRLTNRGTEPRRLSLFVYQRLVLGTLPEGAASLRSWQRDRVLCAQRREASDFSEGIAFSFVVSGPVLAESVTCDRAAFIGVHGSVQAPAALQQPQLDGAQGEGFDACFARQLLFTLAPGASSTFDVALGEAVGEAELEALTQRYATQQAISAALETVVKFWRDQLGRIRVRSPSPELDHMINGWLPYQALSCRIWGRTAYYQSSGAYGFRDQLQDAGNLCLLWPARTRHQILLHARHQFEEGDVLHWWHAEPVERGIRTRFSDDLLWLPYVTGQYLDRSGDASILDESVPFLAAAGLDPGEEERYLKAQWSATPANLYEHCCRALDRSLTQGAHRLPLMGTGDWNDGMNRVGREGRGESVWLGFFLCGLLERFTPLAQARGDKDRAERYSAYRSALVDALNDTGWDGQWYRRAYYDDGTPLGTHEAAECRIDGLVQAWAAMSGIAPPERSGQAMSALESHLVDEASGLIRLLTPPFVNAAEDPGYIKGYVAGVRENGGQYTHATCWMIAAAAQLGLRDRAARWLAMISPLAHTRRAALLARYKVEPYVIVADIYAARPHVGRGGWTWYTGSAGLGYRIALESILGLRIAEGRVLELRPCVPDDWPHYEIEYQAPDSESRYQIHIRNPDACSEAVIAASVDGAPLSVSDGMLRLELATDGEIHQVAVTLGRRGAR